MGAFDASIWVMDSASINVVFGKTLLFEALILGSTLIKVLFGKTPCVSFGLFLSGQSTSMLQRHFPCMQLSSAMHPPVPPMSSATQSYWFSMQYLQKCPEPQRMRSLRKGR
jgi:hypothetical protein